MQVSLRPKLTLNRLIYLLSFLGIYGTPYWVQRLVPAHYIVAGTTVLRLVQDVRAGRFRRDRLKHRLQEAAFTAVAGWAVWLRVRAPLGPLGLLPLPRCARGRMPAAGLTGPLYAPPPSPQASRTISTLILVAQWVLWARARF